MTYHSMSPMGGTLSGYAALFDALTTSSVLLKADAPRYTIMAATALHLKHAGVKREDIIGSAFFEVYPPNPDLPTATAEMNLQFSLQYVLKHKIPHLLPIHRYDVADGMGRYVERYWRVENNPVFGEDGEVAFILQTVEELTEQAKAAFFTDITGRRKAEEAIRLTEDNLRNTILQAPVAMAILRGPDFIVELANSYMFELWGRGESELLNRSIFDGLPEVKDQGYEELLSGVYKTGKRLSASEIPVTLPRDGNAETVYMNLLCEAYREGDGRITGIIAVGTDVTEQVFNRRILEQNEAELQKRVALRTQDLQQQQLFIRSILEATFDGIYALKAVRNVEGNIIDFQYLFANKNIAGLLKLEEREVIGASMLTLIPENRDNGFFTRFCNSLNEGQTFKDEIHFVAQAINNWYEYVITPIDGETLVVSTRDISDKKTAQFRIEEQKNLLNSILKNSSNGISVSKVFRNEKGVVIDAITILANDAAVKYIGLPREIYLSKKATEIEPGIIGSPYYKACIHTLESGEPFMMQYRTESTNRWLELTVSRLDGEHLIQVFTDVTAIKEAQLELERTVDELKRSNESLEEFAFAASHDLKEPIRKIQFYTSQIKSEAGSEFMESVNRAFNRIEHATQRMRSLIDDLLLYSHVTQRPHEAERIDLKEVISRVLEDLEIDIQEKKALVDVGPMPVVAGYKTQLQQLFQNVVSNALKYSKKSEPPHIFIVANQTVSEGKKFHEISIRDNGIGFDQKYEAKIFQIFSQLHGKKEYGGTGVGLSIVKKVVANHNGFIQVESESGKGSTFKIYLPV